MLAALLRAKHVKLVKWQQQQQRNVNFRQQNGGEVTREQRNNRRNVRENGAPGGNSGGGNADGNPRPYRNTGGGFGNGGDRPPRQNRNFEVVVNVNLIVNLAQIKLV
ncbi:hypothetical protein ACLKA6_012224 [Drosophila palustris]